jgi:hypothetical protein
MKKNGYFDITQKVCEGRLHPVRLRLDSGLLLTSQHPVTNCNSTEALRLSFKKIVDTDFEATEWTGQRWTPSASSLRTATADRNYLMTDGGGTASRRVNTWTKSHVEGAVRDRLLARRARFRTTESRAFQVRDGLPIPDKAGKPFGLDSSPIGKDIHRDVDGNGTGDASSRREAAPPPVRAATVREEVHAPRTSAHEDHALVLRPPPRIFPSTSDALNQWNVAVSTGVKVEADRVQSTRASTSPTKRRLRPT